MHFAICISVIADDGLLHCNFSSLPFFIVIEPLNDLSEAAAIFQIGHKRVVSLAEIQDHWVGLGLAPAKLEEIVEVGKLPSSIEWHRFVVVACGKLADVIFMFH